MVGFAHLISGCHPAFKDSDIRCPGAGWCTWMPDIGRMTDGGDGWRMTDTLDVDWWSGWRISPDIYGCLPDIILNCQISPDISGYRIDIRWMLDWYLPDKGVDFGYPISTSDFQVRYPSSVIQYCGPSRIMDDGWRQGIRYRSALSDIQYPGPISDIG